MASSGAWAGQLAGRDVASLDMDAHERSFWSGYEHHQSFGKDAEASRKYVRGQAAHHGIQVIQDVQPVTLTGWM